jgi:hypothetical protein
MVDKPSSQALRTKVLIRAYHRHLRAKPSTLEKHVLVRAAVLTCRAEMAAADPAVSVDEVVRADNCAARARAELAKAISARHANGHRGRSEPRPARGLLSDALSEPVPSAEATP